MGTEASQSLVCYNSKYMKKTVIALVTLAIILTGVFVPIKQVQTGGSCPDKSGTQRHNLVLGDTLPQAGNGSVNGEGCSPLTTHKLYLL